MANADDDVNIESLTLEKDISFIIYYIGVRYERKWSLTYYTYKEHTDLTNITDPT